MANQNGLNTPSPVGQSGSQIYAADAEASDAYVITLDPVPLAYTEGMVLNFKANTANTGGATLNVNSLGVKNILKQNDQALATGDIEAGQIVTVVYDGVSFQMQSQLAQAPVNPYAVLQDGSPVYAVDSVGTDAYAITLSPAPAAYTDGMSITFKAGTVNTDAATLDVNALGAVAIKKLNDQDLSSGDIEAGQIVTVIYDSTGPTWQMQSQTAIAPGAGTVTNVATGVGLRGGPITGTGTVNLATQNAASGRLTLTTGVPVTTVDVTAATTIYYTPYNGLDNDIYSGAVWTRFQLSQLSIAVPATTDTAYDVFLDYNAGTPALALEAWSSLTARATALVYQDGVLVLSGTTTKKYLGSFRTTGVSGQTADSVANRFVWNYYNRQVRPMTRFETTDSWTYTTATVRQANGSTANQLNFFIGVSEDAVNAIMYVGIDNPGQIAACVGIGLDSTTAFSSNSSFSRIDTKSYGLTVLSASYMGLPGIGSHYLSWLEVSQASGTTTWIGDGAAITVVASASGIIGSIRG